jgi:adenylyl- and sulfurtransferase ThiI
MKYFLLEQFNLVLIRYGEVWLKSQKVKIRMLKDLMSNLKNMLLQKGIPFHKYQLSRDSSRIFFFFDNKHISRALDVIQKTFGIHSFSPALRTSNKIENITERTIEVANEILDKNDSFALRVKRSGKHEYSSLDLAKIVGQKVIDHFAEYNLRVDLSNPNKKIFIEVRDDFSYIFTHIFNTPWGGLPIEPRKNILVMDVGRIEDLMAGFLLMRRGSKIYPILFDMQNNEKIFEERLENWRQLLDYIPYKKFRLYRIQLTKIFDRIISKLDRKEYTCSLCRLLRYNVNSLISESVEFQDLNLVRAITDGLNLNGSSLCTDDVDLQTISLNYLFSNYPIFTPLVSLSDSEIRLIEHKISKNFKFVDYCKYKPQDQIFDKDIVKSLCTDLNIKAFLKGLFSLIEEINLN